MEMLERRLGKKLLLARSEKVLISCYLYSEICVSELGEVLVSRFEG